MANKLFGEADPQYDALRVQSNQAILAGPGDGTTGDGGLQNKIYVWHADGSTLDIFDPDEAGVNAAYAASVSGDTVVRPSIEIACTAPITIPAGVIDFPLSDGAILSFSGFDGAAITLSAGSKMFFPVVRFVATGTDAIGIDASVDDCLLYEPDVEVSGATATNHAINGGHSPTASEAWFMVHRASSGHSIAWSETFDFNDTVNDTIWHAIESWPSGFDHVTDAGHMAMNYQANALYIARGTKIWSLSNLAAIRASPSTTPTWTVVADNTTNVGGYNIINIVNIAMWNDVLCAMVRTSHTDYHYGEYVSGVWTWTYQGYDSTGNQYITYHLSTVKTGAAADTMRVYNPSSASFGVIYYDKLCGFGFGGTQPVWRNSQVGGTDFVTTWNALSTTTKIIDESGATLHDTGLTEKSGYSVTGSLFSTHIYVVMEDGELFLSDDGASFTNPITWNNGAVQDDHERGGGALVWFRGSIPAGGEAVHISLDRGVSTHDKTGNLYSVISAAPSGMTLRGCQLVYPT